MPTYSYKCKKCGHVLEVFQGINDAPLSDCAACGAGNSLEKMLFSAPVFALKGSGWYKTDYAKDKPADKPADKSASEGGNNTGAAE